MKLLHITNDFAGSKVYVNLVNAINDKGVEQVVYTAMRRSNSDEVNNNLPVDAVNVIYRPILTNYTRVDFFAKHRRILKDLNKNISLSGIDAIHAHTWYSDGAVALSLYKKYGISYAVSIRNTDINTFYPYFIHLRRWGREILRNAKAIVFISKAHEVRFREIFADSTDLDDFMSKSVVIPNGVNSYWLKHFVPQQHNSNPINLIYVGKFDPGKNVPRLMEAVIKLNDKGIDYHLDIVGGTGSDTAKIEKLIETYPDYFTFHGVIRDKDVLSGLYRKCNAFVMPSLHETFGLVYVEALTQGLPILWTKGEGVDGFLDNNYGESCDPRSVSSIVEGIANLKKNYDNYIIDKDFIFNNFDWDKIADKYLQLYSK